MGKYFGTDGFRGEGNVTLTADHAYQIGRFLGWYFGQTRGEDGPARILIGKDTRRSSYMLEYALVGGLTASGADAYLLHVTTTPSVSHVVRTDGFDCGVMISASHNPYYDNGIKLFNAAGEKMEESVTALAEAWLDGTLTAFGRHWETLPLATGRQIGRSVDYVAGRNRYVGYLISLGLYGFKGLRIGLDCANGSAWNIAKSVFDALGAETHVIHAEPDGFNINENAGSTHIAALQKLVLQEHLDAGFAYDGDADRCLCVDETGQIVNGDHILCFCADYMRSQGALAGDTVVATVMSNLALFQTLERAGIRCVQTSVGDKYVWEAMAAQGYSLGGEQSGHIIFSQYATTGDGILTSLKVMEVMLAKKKRLSQLRQMLTLYPQVVRNVPVRDRAAAMADPQVLSAAAAITARLGASGRLLLRPSGTEPVMRVMVEAPDSETCAQCAEKMAQVLESRGWTR